MKYASISPAENIRPASVARVTRAETAGAPRSGTAQDRRARWDRGASLTTSVGVAARSIAIGVRVVTIPLALHLLGSERYGLWLSVGSLLAWIGFMGPGLGYGLVNAVSDASGRDDWPAMRRHVSTAVFTIGSFGVLLLTMSPLLRTWPGIVQLFGIAGSPALAREAQTLIGIAAALFALSLSLEFIGALCSGLQEGYLSSVASISASVLMLAGVLLMAGHGGSLVTFAVVVGLPPILANLALSAYVLWRRYPQLRPSWRLWNRDSFVLLMGFGGWMLLVQMGELAIFQSANLLIAGRFGPAEVTRYAVPAALFFNVSNLCYLLVQPYWPALKEASVRKDWEWIRGVTVRTLATRLSLMAMACVVIVLAGPAFIRLWSGESIIPSRTLLLTMSAYYLLVVWNGSYMVLLLGLGLVRTKALLTVMVGLSHVGGFLLLSPYLGLSAMPVGGAIGVLIDGLIASRVASRVVRERSEAAV